MKKALKINSSLYLNMDNIACWEESARHLCITMNACNDTYLNYITIGVDDGSDYDYSDMMVSINEFERITQELKMYMGVI